MITISYLIILPAIASVMLTLVTCNSANVVTFLMFVASLSSSFNSPVVVLTLTVLFNIVSSTILPSKYPLI